MNRRKLGWALLLALIAFPALSWAQPYIPDPDVYGKIASATQPVTLMGKIGYDKNHGGYYLKNNPQYNFGNKVILNQDHGKLEKLHKRGKIASIQGKVDPREIFAHHLFIERINGKKYTGKQAPLIRP